MTVITVPNSVGIIPTGVIQAFAGAEAATPIGWLICGGQEISRTDFAALFAVIGTTYGAGNGTSTFNVPDLRGRVAAGRDNMAGTAINRITSAVSGLTGTTLGAAGGDQRIQQHTHSISWSGTTANETQDHTHNFNPRSAGGWNSGATQLIINGGSQYWGLRSTNNNGDGGTVGSTYGRSASHNHTYSGSGTSGPHSQVQGGLSQNLQPTLILNYIIKA